jgi:hypothetical protein
MKIEVSYFFINIYMNIKKCFIIALLTVLLLFLTCQVHANLYGTPFPTKEGMMGKYKTWGGHEYYVPYAAQWVNEYR